MVSSNYSSLWSGECQCGIRTSGRVVGALHVVGNVQKIIFRGYSITFQAPVLCLTLNCSKSNNKYSKNNCPSLPDPRNESQLQGFLGFPTGAPDHWPDRPREKWIIYGQKFAGPSAEPSHRGIILYPNNTLFPTYNGVLFCSCLHHRALMRS